MSSIVRRELEQYISTEQTIISRRLRNIVAEFVANRNYELSSAIEGLMSTIRMFTPLKSSYTSPMEYIDALRSYALALSIVSEMLEEAEINRDLIDVSKRIMDMAKEGLPVGKIADESRKILSDMGDLGNRVFINGCRKYINILVGKIKELDPQELEIIKETVKEIVNNVERPYSRISDVARILGTKEKDLVSILKRIGEKDPNIIVTKSLITLKDQMKSYLEKRIGEHHYILINDLAREWSVDPRDVIEVLNEVSEIYPGLEIFEGIIVSTLKDLADYFAMAVEDAMVTTVRALAIKIGVESKALRSILVRLHKHAPDIVLGNSEIVAHRQKIIEWIKSVVGERSRVFIEEFSGRLGAPVKSTKKFIEYISMMFRDIIISKNEVIFVPNLSNDILAEIKTGEESREVREIVRKHPKTIEAEVFNSINKILKDFEKKITGGEE